ncbi:muconolactone Delta-isomerase [Advenella sp. RU8]|uniref:muconolactone Delta-isomerase n=1 Tax=Advenella TaxID=290425 RepID=UPI00145F8161|nr:MULTISPECIES: muconolactone Delta-isomerase family protein [Advenella]MDD3757105.1 muconolactone Delta-isomerase family protein [Advenella sp.]NLN66741.1 muconolactone delta-isomerase [Alcaligenaceae bacterium]NLY33908.1 muconolactone delta-isomerase [Alcaligenaceae bacterium]WKU19065.1 muconolactone Delta-isomerase family protein [Advenella alkanexedens]
MLYCVMMDVNVPADMDPAELAKLREAEKNRAIEMQKSGKFVHLWRVAGRPANISIFDCESNDELHDLLSSLPMFPYFSIKVVPLAKHPSSIK